MSAAAVPNRILQRFQAFNSAIASSKPSLGKQEAPPNGSYLVVVTGLSVRESGIKVGNATVPALFANFNFRLVGQDPDPTRTEPREWEGALFRFVAPADLPKIPEKQQNGLQWDLDRFLGYAKVILGQDPTKMSGDALISAMYAACNSEDPSNPIVLRINISRNKDGKYPREDVLERLPNEIVGEYPADQTAG